MFHCKAAPASIYAGCVTLDLKCLLAGPPPAIFKNENCPRTESGTGLALMNSYEAAQHFCQHPLHEGTKSLDLAAREGVLKQKSILIIPWLKTS